MHVYQKTTRKHYLWYSISCCRIVHASRKLAGKRKGTNPRCTGEFVNVPQLWNEAPPHELFVQSQSSMEAERRSWS